MAAKLVSVVCAVVCVWTLGNGDARACSYVREVLAAFWVGSYPPVSVTVSPNQAGIMLFEWYHGSDSYDPFFLLPNLEVLVDGVVVPSVNYKVKSLSYDELAIVGIEKIPYSINVDPDPRSRRKVYGMAAVFPIGGWDSSKSNAVLVTYPPRCLVDWPDEDASECLTVDPHEPVRIDVDVASVVDSISMVVGEPTVTEKEYCAPVDCWNVSDCTIACNNNLRIRRLISLPFEVSGNQMPTLARIKVCEENPGYCKNMITVIQAGVTSPFNIVVEDIVDPSTVISCVATIEVTHLDALGVAVSEPQVFEFKTFGAVEVSAEQCGDAIVYPECHQTEDLTGPEVVEGSDNAGLEIDVVESGDPDTGIDLVNDFGTDVQIPDQTDLDADTGISNGGGCNAGLNHKSASGIPLLVLGLLLCCAAALRSSQRRSGNHPGR